MPADEQAHHLACIARQLVNGAVNIVDLRPRCALVLCCECGSAERLLCCNAQLLAFAVVQESMAHYNKGPTHEFALVLEPVGIVQNPQESLLQQVVRLVIIMCQFICKFVQFSHSCKQQFLNFVFFHLLCFKS